MEMISDRVFYFPCSLAEIILLLIIVNIVDVLLPEHSSIELRSMFVFFLHRFSLFKKIWKSFIQKFVDEKSTGEVEKEQKPACICGNLDSERKISLEEVKMTMEELVLLEKASESGEIGTLFEEDVSHEEVQEAFGLFDENNDGFIDANDLRNALFKLGFISASDAECEKMISAFDDDRDGRINFNEFVKLLEYSFS